MKQEEIINWVKENEHKYPKVFKSDHWLIQILKDFADELQAKEVSEMYLNMQYYMEYCIDTGYVTPQDWIEKYKHF